MEIEQQFNKASEYLANQNWRDAELIYRSILETQPDTWQAWLNVGLCCHNSSKFEDAKKAYQAGLTINPECESGWFLISKCLNELKEYKDAVQALEKCLHYNDQNP